MSRRYGLALGALAVTIAAVAIGMLVLTLALRSQANDRAQASCNFGANVRSMYELLNRSDGPERESLVHAMLPLQDCALLISEGHPVFVSPHLQRRALSVVRTEHRLPLLENGEISGTVPFPGAPPRGAITPGD